MAQETTLADLCRELLILGDQIYRGTSQLPDGNTLRQRVLELFESLKSRGSKRGFLPADIEDAQYALAAFLDEAIQYSSWPEKMTWGLHPLQAYYFREANAGVNFFVRLDQARRRSQDAAEVYYLCLMLGFMGRLRDPRLAQDLLNLHEDLRRELGKGTGKDLAPHGGRPDEGTGESRSFPFLLISVSGLLAALLLSGILYLLLLSSRGDAVEVLTRLSKGTGG